MLSILAATVIFSGEALNNEGKCIFKENYAITRNEGRVTEVTTTYTTPEGRLIATLTSQFDTHPHLPKTHYKRSALEYGATPCGPLLQIYRESKKMFESKEMRATPKMVAGHGFYFFILDHLESLVAGATETISLVQPDRLTSHAFRISAKIDRENPQLALVKMELKNPLLRPLVPHMELVIDRTTKTLLSYSGIDGFAMVVDKRHPITIEYSSPRQM